MNKLECQLSYLQFFYYSENYNSFLNSNNFSPVHGTGLTLVLYNSKAWKIQIIYDVRNQQSASKKMNAMTQIRKKKIQTQLFNYSSLKTMRSTLLVSFFYLKEVLLSPLILFNHLLFVWMNSFLPKLKKRQWKWMRDKYSGVGCFMVGLL